MMKNFSCLAAIAATTIALILPATADAQGIFKRDPIVNPDATNMPTDPAAAPSSPSGGYTTNSSPTTTTTSPGAYPSRGTFGKFSNYGSFSRYKRSGRYTYQKSGKQQKMILNPDPMYPGFSRPDTATSPNGNYRRGGYSNYGRSQSSNGCSTNVIGSPIPSAVPLDRSGRPCN